MHLKRYLFNGLFVFTIDKKEESSGTFGLQFSFYVRIFNNRVFL